jgi:hypothetical protein
MSDALPTPRSMLRVGYWVSVWCKVCRRQDFADM